MTFSEASKELLRFWGICERIQGKSRKFIGFGEILVKCWNIFERLRTERWWT
jgi:hypothetical protein